MTRYFDINPNDDKHLATFELIYYPGFSPDLVELPVEYVEESYGHISILHPTETLEIIPGLPQPAMVSTGSHADGLQVSVWRLSNPVHPQETDSDLTDKEWRKESGYNVYYMLIASLCDVLGGRELDYIPSPFVYDMKANLSTLNMGQTMKLLQEAERWYLKPHEKLAALGGKATTEAKVESSKTNQIAASVANVAKADATAREIVESGIDCVQLASRESIPIKSAKQKLRRSYKRMGVALPEEVLSGENSIIELGADHSTLADALRALETEEATDAAHETTH